MVCSQALKFFAVHYGLLLAYASILTQGRRASASRKSLCTLAEKLLMCFRTSPLNYHCILSHRSVNTTRNVYNFSGWLGKFRAGRPRNPSGQGCLSINYRAERGSAGERNFATLGQDERPCEKFDKTGPAKLLPMYYSISKEMTTLKESWG